MLVIGQGTDPKANNDVTIAFDKMILASLEGKPGSDSTAIQEIKDRIATYESQHGVVDTLKVESRQQAEQDQKLKILEGFAKLIHPNG